MSVNYRIDDIPRAHGDVLHARSTVILDVLLYLTLPFTVGRFVDRHPYVLLIVGDNDRAKTRELSVDLTVVDRPEPMEAQCLLIPSTQRSLGIVVLSTTPQFTQL